MDPRLMDFLYQALEQNPYIYAVTASRQDGSLVQVIAGRANTAVLQAHQAPSGTAYIIRTVLPQQGYSLLRDICRDKELNILSIREERDQDQVRQVLAESAHQEATPSLHFTRPGIVPIVKAPGIICLRANPNLESVFSVALLPVPGQDDASKSTKRRTWPGHGPEVRHAGEFPRRSYSEDQILSAKQRFWATRAFFEGAS